MRSYKTIWFISKYAMAPNEAWVGHRAHYLIKELQKLGEKVYIINSNSFNKMKILSLKKIYNFRTIDEVNYLTIKTTRYKDSFSFKRVISWIEFEIKLFFIPLKKLTRPDVIIVSSLSLLTIINGLIMKYRFNSKLIFEIRDIWPLSLIEYKGYSNFNIFILILSILEKVGYLFSDRIVGTMPKLEKHVEKTVGKNKKVSFIPIGFNSNDSTINKTIINSRIKEILDSDKIVITYVGSIGISNNLETFFKTIHELKFNKNLFFLVIGDGELKEKFSKQYQLCNNLIFNDAIDKKYIHNILKRSDILYFSLSKNKIWEFGQSLNKIIDYMLAGKPIIASYSGYKSMINEAKCGEFVDVDNQKKLKKAIMKYSNFSNSERTAIGERGKRWLYKYRTYERLAKDYYDIIEDL